MGERAGKRGERGVALLVTLLTVALLTITVMEFTYATQVDYRRTVHWLGARKAALIAESGVDLAAELLALDLLIGESDGLTEAWAQCLEPAPWTCSTAVAEFCSLDLALTDEEGDARGRLSVRIEDESGLYNLNRLQGAAPAETARLERLLLFGGLDSEVAGPLVDWIDGDQSPSLFPRGAEAAQYLQEESHYGPPDRPLLTFRELALIRGVGASELVALRRIATALDAAADLVNVNTAPPDVLRALDPDLDDELVLAAILEQRCIKPFSDFADLTTRIEAVAGSGTAGLLSFSSSYFRVRTTAQIDDVYQSAEALVRRDDGRTRIVYFLPRRGPNILGVDMSAATSLNDLGLLAASTGGRL